MSTKRITIAKLGGAAGAAVLTRFRQWHTARDLSRDPDALRSSEHWTPKLHQTMDAFADRFRQHGSELPIVFFSEHIDMWSGAPFGYRWIDAIGVKGRGIDLWSDRYDLYCYQLPDGGTLQRGLQRVFRRKALRKRDPQEDMWALSVIQEAVLAWDFLVKEALLVILECPLGGSALDEEVSESLGKVPRWIGASPRRRS